MSGQRHLWAGEYADAEHPRPAVPRLDGRTAAQAAPQVAPPPPARKVRRPARLAGAISAAVVLSAAGVALAAGLIDTGGDSSSNSAAALAPAGGGRVPEGTIGRVYAAAGPSVVAVQANQDGGTASGTGFVVDGRGTIITNSHVVGSARNARVRFGERPPIQAEVLGTDPSSDLAALRIDPARAGNPKPLALANSRDVAVGDQVVAIGHPFGLDRTATAGIVSGLERQIEAPNGFSIDEVIQTDAPINPGNSGGPLLDAKGRVIGVNSQIAASAGGGGNVGIGFAVPSDTVREVLPTLARGEQVERAYLGLTTSAAARGAAVENVTAGGPAARGGMRRSDTVTSVAGRTVRDPDDVAKAIADRKPGDTIEVDVVRGGRTVSLDVTLGERPAQRAP